MGYTLIKKKQYYTDYQLINIINLNFAQINQIVCEIH